MSAARDLLRRLSHPWVVRACRIAIGVIFLAAALPKIGDTASFAKQVHNFRMVPIALENLFAMCLPWIALVIAMALLLGIRARAGALLASGLMVVFIVAIAQAVARGLDIECGCFGTADASSVGLTKLAEDFVMLALAVIGSLRSGAPR